MSVFTVIAVLYGLGALAFFAYICYEEFKSFVGEHGPMLTVGFFCSLFWPVALLCLLADRLFAPEDNEEEGK